MDYFEKLKNPIQSTTDFGHLLGLQKPSPTTAADLTFKDNHFKLSKDLTGFNQLDRPTKRVLDAYKQKYFPSYQKSSTWNNIKQSFSKGWQSFKKLFKFGRGIPKKRKLIGGKNAFKKKTMQKMRRKLT